MVCACSAISAVTGAVAAAEVAVHAAPNSAVAAMSTNPDLRSDIGDTSDIVVPSPRHRGLSSPTVGGGIDTVPPLTPNERFPQLADFSPEETLTRDAQAGQVAALGALLARHQAGMRATATAILGHGPDAEDAVQEAALIALRRIGDVRDPAAVGPWLRMVAADGGAQRLPDASARALARTV